MRGGYDTWFFLYINDMAKALAAVSISGLAFRLLNKVIQEGLKKEVMETAYQISQRLDYRERR